MWRHYVYKHLKKDTGEPFYVGKGSFRRDRKPSYERACDKNHARNKRWRNVVNKHGFDVVIIAHCKTDKVSQQLEKDIIKEIGRDDLGLGPLVNFTDGGDGHCGIIVSDELRVKRSINASRPRTKVYESVSEAAERCGFNMKTLYNWLSGHRKNPTDLRFI